MYFAAKNPKRNSHNLKGSRKKTLFGEIMMMTDENAKDIVTIILKIVIDFEKRSAKRGIKM